MLNHLRGLAQALDVSAPEHAPGSIPFLYSQDEELGGPQEGPGAVSEVSVQHRQPCFPRTVDGLW
jgi:hypothetical protein